MTEEELATIESGLSEALLYESIDGEVGRRYPWAVQLWTDIGNLLDEVKRLRTACHDVLVLGEDCLIQSRGMREVEITYVEVERWRLNELEKALEVLKGEVDA